MEALRFSFEDKTLLLSRVEKPVIVTTNQVLVKIAYAGVCGTDLHILAGEFPCSERGSITLGHEISGVVEEVGHHVINIKEGDKVAIDPNKGCGRCTFCHAGTPHFCKTGCVINTIGIFRDGGWANYVICPEEQVYKLPGELNLEQAVLTEPISCIIHGMDLLGPIAVGDKILIIGAGIVGTLWICVAHHQGHRNVVVLEPNSARIETLRRLNTGYTTLTPTQLRKNRMAQPEKYIFDVVIDCSGNASAMEEAVGFLNFGGRLCVFGVAPPNSRMEISPFDIFRKEIKIIGVNINPFTFIKALGLIEAMGNRYLNFSNLGIRAFPLSHYKEAIEKLKTGTITKAIFKM